MRTHLDTYALLWFLKNDEQLSTKARETIENSNNAVLVSIASFWEMAIKTSIGKLKLERPLREVEKRVVEHGMEIWTIRFEDTDVVSRLPMFHKDPFDRMLIAQALSDDFTLVSNEAVFDKYGVKRIW